MPTDEPEPLRRGKRFHEDVQNEWEQEAEGKVKREKGIRKPGGRRGRVDIHVDADDDQVAVVEIKASHWDRMTEKAVRRNVRRHIRQVWDYIESQLKLEKTVSPGIIFPKRPQSAERLRLVEELFDEEGIPVVWQDETIEERRERAAQSE